MKDNSNRPILITGCSSGIGEHCAFGLQARGYRVFATARKPEDAARLEAQGLEALQLDLDHSASIRAAAEEVLSRTDGRLYGLFNNAGYGQPGAVEDLSREALRRQFETNVFGTLELINALIPAMRRQGEGRIVQNSSVLGLVALRWRGAYNASKYALEGFYDTLRLELQGSGIHCVLIEPGPIRSNFRANALARFREHIDSEHSAHRAAYAAVLERLTRAGPAAPFTLGPEAVLDKLVLALEQPRPRPRYYVTVPTYLFGYLKRLLSARMLDRVLARIE